MFHLCLKVVFSNLKNKGKSQAFSRQGLMSSPHFIMERRTVLTFLLPPKCWEQVSCHHSWCEKLPLFLAPSFSNDINVKLSLFIMCLYDANEVYISILHIRKYLRVKASQLTDHQV